MEMLTTKQPNLSLVQQITSFNDCTENDLSECVSFKSTDGDPGWQIKTDFEEIIESVLQTLSEMMRKIIWPLLTLLYLLIVEYLML